MKYFIDTNIFLRTLVKENEKTFEECYKFLEKIKKNKLKAVTSTLVLAETAWTLSSYYEFSKKEVVKALKSIINLRGLKFMDKHQPLLSIKLYEENNIKYIDSQIASIKQIYDKQWIIVSYDKDYDKLNLLRLEPSEV